MVNFLITISSCLFFVFLLAFILSFFIDLKFRLSWVLGSSALFYIYVFLLYKGSHLLFLGSILEELHFNWGGKIVAILFSISILFFTRKIYSDFSLSDAGITFKQAKGSILPSILVILLMIVLRVLILPIFFEESPNYSGEYIWFQSLLPGIDEEIFLRGVLLYYLSIACSSPCFLFKGAKINVSGILITVLFGLVHGLRYSHGEWSFELSIFVVTSIVGFLLLWIRERSGSVFLPILAHNIYNVAGIFI